MDWLLADASVFGIDPSAVSAITQLGLTGGLIIFAALVILGKLVAGFLLDRAELRADKLQAGLDAAAAVNAKFPQTIADLNASHSTEVERMTQAHEREMTALSGEVRRLQDMMQARQQQ